MARVGIIQQADRIMVRVRIGVRVKVRVGVRARVRVGVRGRVRVRVRVRGRVRVRVRVRVRARARVRVRAMVGLGVGVRVRVRVGVLREATPALGVEQPHAEGRVARPLGWRAFGGRAIALRALMRGVGEVEAPHHAPG